MWAPSRRTALAVLMPTLLAGVVLGGCTDGGGGGCSPPVGAKWDRWDMAASTYTYCYHGCVVDWLVNNTESLGLNKYAGVVGVDHYWTHQGMPCVDGKPQEFVKQDALTLKWKKQFPDMKMLQYRILSAVNYDMVVQSKIQSDPYAVVRWRHAPGASSVAPNGSCPAGFSGTCNSGDVCWNGKSACFNSPTRINNPANKCDFHISAAAYNWSNPELGDWFLEDVIKPTLVHADGIWLDGIGPDNGGYMCAGVCCGYGASNSPLDQAEIDSHCKGQADATTKVQKYLIANGGWEAQKCFDYKSGRDLPTQSDSPADCASKLQKWSKFGADHSNYNFVVAYGSRTGGRDGYNDTNVEATVAAFMLMRGEHWLFSIAPNGGSGGKSYPPYNQDSGTLTPATAKILTSDHGTPQGNMTSVSGKEGVFQRVYSKATIILDCSDFSAKFEEH